jgi:hypothetical protein
MSAVLTPVASASMKAFRIDLPAALGALRPTEIAMPVVPDDGVLIRVRASSANPVDLFSTYLMRRRKPAVLARNGSTRCGASPDAFVLVSVIGSTSLVAYSVLAGLPRHLQATSR